jgi:hypothetical protein
VAKRVLIYPAYLIGLIERRAAATLPRFGQKLVLRILGLLGMSQNKQHLSATICISIFNRPSRDLLSISADKHRTVRPDPDASEQRPRLSPLHRQCWRFDRGQRPDVIKQFAFMFLLDRGVRCENEIRCSKSHRYNRRQGEVSIETLTIKLPEALLRLLPMPKEDSRFEGSFGTQGSYENQEYQTENSAHECSDANLLNFQRSPFYDCSC